MLEIIIKLVDFVLLIPKQIHGISIQRIPPYRRIHVLISRADAFVAEAFEVLYLIVDLLLNRIIWRPHRTVIGNRLHRRADYAKVQVGLFHLIRVHPAALLLTFLRQLLLLAPLGPIYCQHFLQVVSVAKVYESILPHSTRRLGSYLSRNSNHILLMQINIVPRIISNMQIWQVVIRINRTKLLIPRFRMRLVLSIGYTAGLLVVIWKARVILVDPIENTRLFVFHLLNNKRLLKLRLNHLSFSFDRHLFLRVVVAVGLLR